MQGTIKVDISTLHDVAKRRRSPTYAARVLEAAVSVVYPYAYFKYSDYMALNEELLKGKKNPQVFDMNTWRPGPPDLPTDQLIMTPGGPERKGCCG